MSSLSTLRADVRKDLDDQDAANYRWTDLVLNRHILRAVQMYQEVSPRDVIVTIAAVEGQRTYSLAAYADLIAVVRVEYPAGDYPPNWVPWELFGTDLTVLVATAPKAGEDIKVYYTGSHTCTEGSATIPAEDEHVVTLGAGAFAAVEWANYAINRVNASPQVVDQYRRWGENRLREFRRELDDLRLRRAHRAPSTVAISGYEI